MSKARRGRHGRATVASQASSGGGGVFTSRVAALSNRPTERTILTTVKAMKQHSRIFDADGELSLSFSCGELPADEAVLATGHQPNGYFWEGVATFLEPRLVERLELDSEAGMFSAVGKRSDLEALQSRLEPLLSGAEDVRTVVSRAETEGFEFDD